jgi:hypothetical protein
LELIGHNEALIAVHMYSALQVDHQGMGKEEMMEEVMEEVVEGTMMARITFSCFQFLL